MTKRISYAGLVLLMLLAAVPASAQTSFDINLGYFKPWAEDSRVEGDVLVVNRQYLWFDFDEFGGFYGEGALTRELGKFFEVSLGFGGYQRTVPAVYADQVHADGREIYQDLKLRILPLTGVVRIFPMGHRRWLQPYVGVGGAANFWKYSETGEFVDGWDNTIFRESFVASGTSFGPVGLFGVRGRITSVADLGVEARYSWAEGDLNEDFLSDKIDLGGWSVLSTIKLRF
jgi:outer membrane protein W